MPTGTERTVSRLVIRHTRSEAATCRAAPTLGGGQAVVEYQEEGAALAGLGQGPAQAADLAAQLGRGDEGTAALDPDDVAVVFEDGQGLADDDPAGAEGPHELRF